MSTLRELQVLKNKQGKKKEKEEEEKDKGRKLAVNNNTDDGN